MSEAQQPHDDWYAAVAVANIPTLLLVLVQLTGDLRWLEEPYRPTRTRGLGDNDTGGLPEQVQADVRQAAAEAIIAWRQGRPPALASPSPELLVRMLSVSLGDPVPTEYGPMLAEELAGDEPAPVRLAAPPGFRVVIIGAGMSGLCAAIALQRAGIEHTIIERHHTVGGTWLENRYPGCGVDVPSHLYSFSFAPHRWSRYFSLRDEIHDYFERVAVEHGVRPNIRFETEVESARWDDDGRRWVIDVRTGDGVREQLEASVLITAVGAFNKPRVPEVVGLDGFEGHSVHTARWPSEGIDLEGKKVAVIGSGASAMQVVPAVADTVGRLTVFQRTPHWAAPFEKFGVPIPDALQLLFSDMPLYRRWYRLRLSWAFNDKNHAALQKDPDWHDPERSINALNDGHRKLLTRYIESELGDRTDLLDDLVPSYPPFGKRMLLDNGWYRTLTRDNVRLVTDGIAEVRPTSVVTTGGEEHEADVIVWATGFDVVHFVAPIEIIGRSGRTLHDTWDGDDARAYLGTAVPDFPNFFCLYGPNTQFGHGGSLVTVIERQVDYLMGLLEQMVASRLDVIEVRPEVHREYNDAVDAAHEAMVWTHPGMDTYYRNSRGRVVVNNPFRIVDVWDRTRRPDLGAYRVETAELVAR